MIRLLFWVIVGALLVAAVRKVAGGGARSGATPPPAVENMVRCCVCGLNLPQSDALRVGGAGATPERWACCAQHAHDAGAPAS
jgi:hypothetical protein